VVKVPDALVVEVNTPENVKISLLAEEVSVNELFMIGTGLG
jgi:hypothetical protein